MQKSLHLCTFGLLPAVALQFCVPQPLIPRMVKLDRGKQDFIHRSNAAIIFTLLLLSF